MEKRIDNINLYRKLSVGAKYKRQGRTAQLILVKQIKERELQCVYIYSYLVSKGDSFLFVRLVYTQADSEEDKPENFMRSTSQYIESNLLKAKRKGNIANAVAVSLNIRIL